MNEIMTTPESIAVLCLLTVGANEEIKHEELTSMLTNPFFMEHVAEKIGPHPQFVSDFRKIRKQLGVQELEQRAITAMNQGLPALKVKSLALMALIGEADGDYDEQEKELVKRVAKALGVNMEEVDSELQKMKEISIDSNKPE